MHVHFDSESIGVHSFSCVLIYTGIVNCTKFLMTHYLHMYTPINPVRIRIKLNCYINFLLCIT